MTPPRLSNRRLRPATRGVSSRSLPAPNTPHHPGAFVAEGPSFTPLRRPRRSEVARYGVAGAFTGRRFPRRAYGGVWAGQIRWGRLTHARAAGILTNPVYAGAYVFGRRRTRQVVHPDGSVHTSTTELPREQWEVLIHDHHPGYITFEEYLANEAKLAANRTNAGARPPREGTAL